MKNTKIIVSILFSGLLISCSGSDPKVEDVGPRINEGLYKAEGSVNDKNLPLVAIVKKDGKTYSYSFFSYKCDNSISSSFKKSGTTFSDNPVAAGGPNVKVLGSDCDVETDIVAHSDSSMKVTVNNEESKDEEYILTLTTENDFLSSMKSLITKSDDFEAVDDACMAVFGTSCEAQELRDKSSE